MRCDEAEKKLKEASEDIDRLKKIFDTNPLNFIIKGEGK
jgi:predicted translin family RNA/ssDNA-binding protein